MKYLPAFLIFLYVFSACEQDNNPENPDVGILMIDSVFFNNIQVRNNAFIRDVDFEELKVRIYFNKKTDTTKFNKTTFFFSGSIDTAYRHYFEKNKKVLHLQLSGKLAALSSYRLVLDQGKNLGGTLPEGFSCTFLTRLDTIDKFPRISDNELLNLVQEKTFSYFWEHAHPVSKLTRERYGSGDIVTSGGSGFGLMAVLVGIERGFITREEGFNHLETIVNFLNKKSTDKFHGAFPHWLNGSTGKVIPFSPKDNGGDLVETAFLMQGLLTVRAYFSQGNPEEKALCDSIDKIWQGVDWSWYRKNQENRLYWHWSPNYQWEMNMPVTGWNEGLIVYVLAASSPTHSIPKPVYDAGWARNGAYPMRNGKPFFGIQLPLGEDYGGPLFFSHYSFLGLDPRNLSDAYASYWEQNTAHSRINYEYCKANPKKYSGYSSKCWGLTASDIQNGYSASSPSNDLGVIAPTAALSSMPYTPAESMEALRFFYYTLGDKLWGPYGFYDAFNLSSTWWANSYLAIDQGPIICMIENHRSGLLWDLFMSCPEIQAGLNKLGFSYTKK